MDRRLLALAGVAIAAAVGLVVVDFATPNSPSYRLFIEEVDPSSVPDRPTNVTDADLAKLPPQVSAAIGSARNGRPSVIERLTREEFAATTALLDELAASQGTSPTILAYSGRTLRLSYGSNATF